ncbi:prepilin-type N-terminal cleavage/methylation domain-containing protein [Bradyrhizobium ontarionense]|uniref:Prepilin-type N-terminal cleavage/methylation domain-containing protein n=1 Tax=Bradyrhizobium ontarionense TaxID=2898149 RepID=A0ABY3RK87_9BRAD|nr:prepilin-type N-terminal cleavage/methylation domain-containing protein [Bradyrhizobium sp. A19]UFZ07876.1 prepilin-type N-terminal cleavage/methylation domain-containing protein [Bradyrhizobium sp. A19]
MSRTLVSLDDKATAGFTLIETLVALAVVAVSLVTIGALMGSSARGSRKLEQHVALVQAAYNVLWLAFPSRLPPASPAQSGESMAHLWRAQAQPFAIDVGAPANTSAWLPQRITLQVRSPSGGTMELETVRLFRRRAE